MEADFLDTFKMLPYPKMQQSFHASENPRTSFSLLAITIDKRRTINLQDLRYGCSPTPQLYLLIQSLTIQFNKYANKFMCMCLHIHMPEDSMQARALFLPCTYQGKNSGRQGLDAGTFTFTFFFFFFDKVSL